MALDALVGAQLVVGFPGTEATDELVRHLRALHAANLILFERNFESPEQTQRLVHRLEGALGRPLFVMVDHEGGRVVRFRQGLTQFADALTIGARQSPEAVEAQGRIEAEELARLGVRGNLAPCVDVLVAGSDPIIGDRSYGSDPALVSRLAAARIRGLQSRGVAACAKHFPGLGAVQRDPHTTLPTIALDWAAMEATHLPPFRAAIEAKVTMVMSSHVCYPSLGEPAGLPATFSPRLIRGLLRERMQFDGLLLTDDLEMGALRDIGSMGELAVRAAAAGHDLLLICSNLEAQAEACAALRTAYQRRQLDPTALDDTTTRLARAAKLFLP